MPRVRRAGARLRCGWCGEVDGAGKPCVVWAGEWCCSGCMSRAVAGDPPLGEEEHTGTIVPTWDYLAGIPAQSDPAPVAEADLFGPLLRLFEDAEALRLKREIQRRSGV